MPDSDPYGWNELDAGRGFPRLPLGLAWLVASLAVGVLGWLLAVVSDRSGDAAVGWLLLGLAILGVVTAGAVVSKRHRVATSIWSIAVSTAFVMAGVAAAVLVSAGDGTVFVSDLLLLGGIPVAGGLVTGVLGLRARRMSR